MNINRINCCSVSFNLNLIIFITGAVTLIIEVTATRVLAPIYGGTIITLSSILTITLCALALGYLYGGKWATKDATLEKLCLILSYSSISILFSVIISLTLLQKFGSELSVMSGPLFFGLLLFFIPIFLLGTISPYIIKIQTKYNNKKHLTEVIGENFFFGTIGSVVGSLLSGFVLIPKLGNQKTIILISVILMFLSISLAIKTKKIITRHKIALIIFIVISVILYTIQNKQKKDYLYSTEGLYSSIIIKDILTMTDKAPVRILKRDLNTSSVMPLSARKMVTHFNILFAYKDMVPNIKNILVLGGGAYLFTKKTHRELPEAKIDIVETEPILFSLAKKYFGLPESKNIKNHVIDARVFLKQTKNKQYDFIFSDVFNDFSPPFYLTTTEYYQQIKRLLTSNGVLGINVVGVIDSKNNQPNFIKSTIKTLKSVFTNVEAYHFNLKTDKTQNVIIFASMNNDLQVGTLDKMKYFYNTKKIELSDTDLKREVLLTDDFAPIFYLNMETDRETMSI